MTLQHRIVVAMGCLIVIAPLALAAETNIVVDHQPTRRGGPAADSAFIDMFGNELSSLLADDFLLSNPSTLTQVTAWGFYDQDNPPASETMRIRFYDARSGDGFPGNILYEHEFSSFSRVNTGHIVADHDGLQEYFYTFDLPTPLPLNASTPYWLELVQLGDVNTYFRWEASSGGNRSNVFMNQFFPDWTFAGTSDSAFQLIAIPEPASIVLISLSLLPMVAAAKGWGHSTFPTNRVPALSNHPRRNWSAPLPEMGLGAALSGSRHGEATRGRVRVEFAIPTTFKSAIRTLPEKKSFYPVDQSKHNTNICRMPCP